MYHNRSLTRIEKYVFDLKYEAHKRREAHPEWETTCQVVEAAICMATGQWARARQCVQSISAETSSGWRSRWLKGWLASAEPGADRGMLQQLEQMRHFWEQKENPKTEEAFAFSMDLLTLTRKACPECDIQPSLSSLLQHFRPYISVQQQQWAEWWQSAAPGGPEIPKLTRIPDTDDLSFLAWPHHRLPFIR